MAAPKITERPLADLRPSPTNARTHPEDQVDRIAGLLTRFGFTSPVLVDAEGIVAGHGRSLAAAKVYAEGGTLRYPGGGDIKAGHVPTIDVSGWSEDERRAYMLADNQVAAQAGWDLDILTSEIAALSALDFDLPSIGFDTDALAHLSIELPTEGTTARQPGSGEQADSTFQHVDQFAVIVKCADAAQQEARFIELRDKYGAEEVKVVVV